MGFSVEDWVVFSVQSSICKSKSVTLWGAVSSLVRCVFFLEIKLRTFFWLCCVDMGFDSWIIFDMVQQTKQVSTLGETFCSALWRTDWTLSWNCTLSRCSEACNQRGDGGFPGLGRVPAKDTVRGLTIKQITLLRINTGSVLCALVETYCCFRFRGVTRLMLI